MSNTITEFELVLMHRDGMSADEAKCERQRAMNDIASIIDGNGSYSEVEDFLLDDYGLEMDYLFDLI